MDLLNFTPKNDDIVVELKVNDTVLMNDDGTPMTITIMGPFCSDAKKVSHDLVDERIKRAKGKKTGITSAEAEELNLLSLARNTRSWNITWGGEKPEFSVELAKEIYDRAFWVRALIEEAKADTLDFMKP